MISVPIIATLSFAAGVVATRAARAAARRLNFMNAPNPIVPQHRAPVAYLGGIGIAAGALVVLVPVHLAGGDSGHALATTLGPPALAFLAVGLYDDLRTLTPARKLALQLMATGVAIFCGLRGHAIAGGVLAPLAAAAWVLLVVNAVNVTDVCDGLVAGTAAIALATIANTDPTLRTPTVAVAGATLGFLVFNWPPASIFLGDAGTHLLGYLIAAAGLVHVNAGPSIASGAVAVLTPGVFLFEVVVLVLARRRRGVAIWKGSPDHFALRLQARGSSRLHTDALAWTGAATYAIVAVSIVVVPAAAAVLLLASVGAVSVWAARTVLSYDVT